MKRWMVMSAAAAALLSCCVARGAKVKTPRGLRKIEDLEVGDEVIVVDPETLEQHTSVITAIRRAPRECGRLHFGAGSLTVTSSHPLYDPRAEEWAPAGDWLLGVREEFLGENGPRRVTQAERFVGVEEVFDVSVAHELHTFVANGVVVHNKQQLRARCPLPAADGARYMEYNQCECGPLIPTLESSAVFCDPDSGAPLCGCSLGDDSSWRTAVGTSDTALRDGEWWTRVERDGPGDVLRVTALPDPKLPVLPGSPNVLTINELGDGSAGFLVRELLPGVEFAWGSLWFWKDGTFPHALGLGASSAVLLGVDEDHAWFQPGPGERRWVASGIPSRVWVKLNWSVDLRGDGGYSFSGWFEREDGALGALQAEDTGESLDDFYRDGGLFAAGDAGAPLALVLGHRSAVDGGSGVLRVTGFVFNR